MSKQYWQTLGQLQDSDASKELSKNEFQESLPAASDLEKESFVNAPASRRDFLKYLGYSTAAATLAASCDIPVKKSIPFAFKPDNVMPGIANYFASTYISGDEALPIIVKVREGRPIKIEGNSKSTLTQGVSSAKAQASVLNLYDNNKLRHPKQKTASGYIEVADLKNIDSAIGNGLATGNIALLTSSIISPTSIEVINAFKAKYPNTTHVVYNAISYDGLLTANELTFGKRAVPQYLFESAKVVVSIGADFLGSWVMPSVFAKGYSKNRKVTNKNIDMSKHFQFESMLSMTGANADERYTHRPSETGAVVNSLLAAVSGGASVVKDAKLAKGIEAAAAALKNAGGNAVVVCGSNDANIQVLVNAINNAIGAYGKTINWGATINTIQGSDVAMEELVKQMNAGAIGTLIMGDVNPAYDYYNSKAFTTGLAKVTNSISFADSITETAGLCKYIIPDGHFLENWGDAEIVTGHVSLIQPTINRLFKSRSWQTSLLKWSGNDTDYETYWRTAWTTKAGSAANLDKLLEKGIIETPTAVAGAVFNAGAVATATAAVAAMQTGTKDEVVLYSKVSMGDGRMANNPWLQELPDPITKAAWDNYAMISFAKAKELGISVDDAYETLPAKPEILVKVGNTELKLAAMVIPGMQANTIAVAMGYGRADAAGMAAKGAGVNAFPAVSFNGKNLVYNVNNVTVSKTGSTYDIAQNQSHGYYEDRQEVVKEITLDDLKKFPNHVFDERAEEFKLILDGGEKMTNEEAIEKFRVEGTIYPDFDRPGAKWGMSIDLNSCFGCGACVVACNAENNVAVVGKQEMMRGHDMHWLRIDRYFATAKNDNDLDNVDVVFMPMMCQHCDNAPCENVCPVAATNHSSEGLNQMTYNRCIGTRYCANNCPYKVRRFNWADYMGADSFKDNQVGKISDASLHMNDELTRMVLNPDVTVRSRGVIEKCSFCVQRLQAGKLTAKKEERKLNDNDIKTACQQACAADAIVFGNVNDKESAIYNIRENESKNRLYYALEQLHVLPNVSYLAKVRNKASIAGLKKVEAHHEGGHGEHGAKGAHDTHGAGGEKHDAGHGDGGHKEGAKKEEHSTAH
jgi:MoCo/4Fe-4S cofactor protein with predicted Tat translocation signal